MLLMQSVQDDTMAVAGFEHHTFMCSSCHDIEHRLVFAKQDPEATVTKEESKAEPTKAPEESDTLERNDTERVLEYTASPTSPLSAEGVERVPVARVLRRVFTRLRGGSNSPTAE
jgi:hypothetical protein